MNKNKREVCTEVAGKTKRSTWTVPPSYAPSYVFYHGKNYERQTFFTISDEQYHDKTVPEMQKSMFVVASSYGWLIMLGHHSNRCYLFNPVSFEKIPLPSVPDNSYRTAVLTAPPDDPNCFVVFVSTFQKPFIYCQIGDNEWIEKGLLSKSDISKHTFFIITVVSCGGKVYVCLYYYAIIVIDVQGNFATNLYQREAICHSIPECIKTVSYYLESCGEMFHVLLLHLQISNEVVSLDVWKICLSTMEYVKVENLGDRIFLLGSSSTSFSSSDLQMKGNCIYFFLDKETYLNKFDMEEGTITTTHPRAKAFSQWKGPFWIVPNFKLQGMRVMRNPEPSKLCPSEDHEGWKDMPQELLELIMSNLFLADCIRMRLTGKAWLTITPPIRSYTLHEQSEHNSNQLPWFLSFPKNKRGVCNLRHPIYNEIYTKEFPELEGAIIRHVKYGWWLMTQGDSIFFFNPSTREIIELPSYTFGYSHVSITFSSPPTSSGYVVLGHSGSTDDSVGILLLREGEDYWEKFWIDTPSSITFTPSNCSPVFCDGVFYCLGKDGRLGIFYPNERNEKDMWKLQLNAVIPEAVLPTTYLLHLNTSKSFIVEHDNEILSVFAGVWGKRVSVYRLDKSKMKWDKLESLGNRVIFVSNVSCILAPTELKSIENRIYFPIFDGNDNLFYSLTTGKYHCFGEKDTRANWLNTSKYWNCAWMKSF